MIRDLVSNHLPGKIKEDVTQLLGEAEPLYIGELPRGWHIAYDIGIEQVFIWDHRGVAFSPDHEELLIKFTEDNRFLAWTIIGSSCWKKMVGNERFARYEKPPSP